MSLINQMLKDLEERRSHLGKTRHEMLLDVQAVSGQTIRKSRRTLFFVGLLLIFISAIGWWGYHALFSTSTISHAANPVTPQRIAVKPSTEAPVTPAVPMQISPVKSKNIVTKIDKPVVTVQTVPAVVDAPPGLDSLAVPVPTPVLAVTKVDRELSRREKAEEAFQRSVSAKKAGQGAAMEKELRQALEHDSSHLLARETLANFFYRSGRLDEAKEVLSAGLTESSKPTTLRKTLARILVDQGDPQKAALELVQGGKPAVAQDPEFHQLLAVIYQRTGQFTAAAQTYRQLLEVERKNGVWWLGLGVALESNRLVPEAIQAYKSALEDPQLKPGLVDYSRSRLATLATTGGN